jgi:histidine ammonia-lyase
MLAQVTAAALASENKVLCHPASVDSIPTSANKEDHVSMGATAAMKASRVVANTRRILAIELLAACQALDLLDPLKSSAALEAARAAARRRVPARSDDRMLAPEIEALGGLVQSGEIAAAAEAVCGRLE